jgi:hypothetical protein
MFYAVASLLIMFVNKIALTTYHFPSYNFLAVSQFCFTFVSLQVLRMAGRVSTTGDDLTSRRSFQKNIE